MHYGFFLTNSDLKSDIFNNNNEKLHETSKRKTIHQRKLLLFFSLALQYIFA